MTADARVLYERLVAENIVPRPWSMEEFRRRADEFRGRSVHLVSQPAEFWDDDAGFCGLYAMTFAAGDVDIMIIRSDGSSEWRDQCIGHEYGHLLLNHVPRGMISDAQIRRLFGDDLFTDPASVRDLLRAHTRADMSIPIEREAEMFAELLAFTPDYADSDRIHDTRMRYGFASPPKRTHPLTRWRPALPPVSGAGTGG
jgi:hypothetical protein